MLYQTKKGEPLLFFSYWNLLGMENSTDDLLFTWRRKNASQKNCDIQYTVLNKLKFSKNKTGYRY